MLKTLAHQVQKWFTWVRAVVKRALRMTAPLKILAYRGFGNGQSFYLMGRVMENKSVGSPKEDARWWNNAKAMYRRFTVDTMSDVTVEAEIHGQSLKTTTDEEGFFRFEIPVELSPNEEDPWHRVRLKLLDDVVETQGPVAAEAKVLVPPANATYGVISDVDDTIIESHAADFLKLAFITFTNNARTRTPLPGVSRFYRALERGPDGESKNPFFFVSSSAWNLYDVLFDFMDLHDIPAGPILLRDLNLDDQKLIKSGHQHKLEKIQRILDTYPHLPFVLIGDAGQDDPIIYREVVRRDSDRVLAVYIRSVRKDSRNQRARAVAEEVRSLDTPMMLVEDDIERLLQHAAESGLVPDSVHSNV